jgi:hypothetical protein
MVQWAKSQAIGNVMGLEEWIEGEREALMKILG